METVEELYGGRFPTYCLETCIQYLPVTSDAK
jgi:hypothetical protein